MCRESMDCKRRESMDCIRRVWNVYKESMDYV